MWASHWSGPDQMKAISLPAMRRGAPGSSTPNAARTASTSAARRPLRAVTSASPTFLTSVAVTPGPPARRPWRPGATAPSSADTDRMSVSATQPLSRRIDEHGRAHLDHDVAAAHGIARHARARRCARARAPAGRARSSGRASARTRPRSCSPGRSAAIGSAPTRHEMRAGAQPRRAIDRLEADQRRPVGRQQRRPLRHARGRCSPSCVDIMRPRPRSRAVVWPSSSLPATWPFSMRITPSASVP